MASKQSTADYLADQLAEAGSIRTRKMFGEYALYCDEKVVALICDDRLFVKPTEAGRVLLREEDLAPPYPGAKSHFRIGEEHWEDRLWLCDLIRATADALLLSKLKKRQM